MNGKTSWPDTLNDLTRDYTWMTVWEITQQKVARSLKRGKKTK